MWGAGAFAGDCKLRAQAPPGLTRRASLGCAEGSLCPCLRASCLVTLRLLGPAARHCAGAPSQPHTEVGSLISSLRDSP